jgi:tRNA (guanine6-N2)-methyltransferase
VLELHQDKRGFGNVADRARADHHVLQGAPPLGHCADKPSGAGHENCGSQHRRLRERAASAQREFVLVRNHNRDTGERTLAIRVAGRAGVSLAQAARPRCGSGYREGVETSTVCAFVTRGLEDIAAAEIGESVGAGGIETRPKLVLMQTSDARGLRRLRTVDDVAVVSASSPSVDDLQALLSLVTEEADLEKPIEQAQRTDRLDGTFSITVSAAHVPYATSSDIREAVASAISTRYEWRYSELQRAPIDIRVFIDGTWALIGVRLFDGPLSRRAYRVVNLRGALRPTVAAALVRIASSGRGRPRIWDPFCGSATILCEAAEQGYEVWGTDIDPEAVEASRENLAAVKREYWTRIECADSTLPKTWKKHQSATAVVTNLPWGKQVAIKSKQALYDSISAGTAELVRRGGTSVLLTTEPKLIQQRLKRDDAVRIVERRIGLLGQTPTILSIQPIK